MKGNVRVISVAILAAVLLSAGSLSAAPWRSLSDTVNGAQPAPRLQWFDFVGPLRVSSPKEFYDNAKPILVPGSPWGGGAGTNAILGIVTDITYGEGGITAFTIRGRVANDSYNHTVALTGTTGANEHGQSAPNISLQLPERMLDVRLAASFADKAPAGDLPVLPPFGPESNIYAINPDRYAWYSYSSVAPPVPDVQTGSGYWVPTWDFTGSKASDPTLGTVDVIELTNMHYRYMDFGCYSVVLPANPLYSLLVDSYNNARDIFINRSVSLKISNYPDALVADNGESQAPVNSNVSVFYRPAVPGSLTFSPNVVIPDHEYAPGGPDLENEMLSFKVNGGDEEPLLWQSVRLLPSGSGHDAADITSVNVWLDADGDGVVDPTDHLLGSGVYPADNTAQVLTFTSPYTIEWGTTPRAIIVSYRMAATAPPGASYRCQLTESEAVGVWSGVTVPNYGLPLTSCWKYIESAKLTFFENGVIQSHFWHPGMDDHNEMLDFWVQPGTTEGVWWNTITLRAQSPGAGNDHTDILAVRVWLDYNHNEQVDISIDGLIGTGIYPMDEGEVTITFASPVAGSLGTMWEPLISYTMSPTAPVGAQYRFSVMGATGTGMISGAPATIVGLPLDSPTKTVATPPIKIGAAKKLPVGDTFFVEGKVITANLFSTMNMAYIEEPDRSAGISVYMPVIPTDPINIGDRVSVLGRCLLYDGAELVMEPIEGHMLPVGPPLEPLGMNTKATGGAAFGGQPAVFDKYIFPGPLYSHGLNNVGSLVRTCGVFTGSTTTAYGHTFWIDDGSGLIDGFHLPTGGPTRGMAVLLPEGVAAPHGNVMVTGILRSVRNPEGGPVRLLVPRSAADIIAY